MSIVSTIFKIFSLSFPDFTPTSIVKTLYVAVTAFTKAQPGISQEKLLERNASKTGEFIDHIPARKSSFGESLSFNLYFCLLICSFEPDIEAMA